MRFPFRFVASSKKAKLLDASQPLEYIELPKFEISNDQQNHHTTGDSFYHNSKSFNSTSLECSQTLNCVAGATLSSQVTTATTAGTSTKQEKTAEIAKSTDVALVHYVDSEGLLQAVAKPIKVSTGQKIKATVASYADSARKIIFRSKDSETVKESENSGPKIEDSPNSAETRVGVQNETQSEAGSRSSVSAQTQTTHKSSRASKIFHYQNKKRKVHTSRKQRILAAKKRHAKRRTTRSGKVLLPVPKNLEAWEDIKQNVKQPNDKGYDLKFDYNKILKPSFVENWLDATVNPLVSALPLSVEQLGNGQIEYANDFEKEADEPARICANCKQDSTGASGLGNCDICYYFLKSERKEFLKYGDAKNIKREFDAHAACPFMSSDVEDSFASTGDSMLGICLMPILGLWEKMDRKIFHAKISFRQFRESVPVWSRNVRAAANKGYGWRSVRPAKCGPQPKTLGDLLPQDFSPRYDQFWPQDYSPAQYYEINANEPPRPKDAVFVKVSYPDPEPESPHISWYSLHCALKRCWLDRKQKQRIRNLALAKASTKSAAKTEENKKAKPRVTFANDVRESKKANTIPTVEPETQTSRFDKRACKDSEVSDVLEFSMGAEATGNPTLVWASAEYIHDSAFVTAAGTNDSTGLPRFEKVAAEDILISTSEESSAVSHLTETLNKANELKVLCPTNDIHVENIETVKFSNQQSGSELNPATEKIFESSPVVSIPPSSSPVDFEGPESASETGPGNPDLLKDVVQQIDDMLESLGYIPKQYSSSNPKVSDSSSCDTLDQSDSIIDFNQSNFVAVGFCEIANVESDNESSIEEIYTRGSGGHSSSQCNQSLTEVLITEILSRYKQGKFDQENDPKAAAETLGALLHEVFKGANDFSEDFTSAEKVSSSAYLDHDDSHRFTLLSDSEDELESLEVSSASEVKSEYDGSVVVSKSSRPILKELKLVRKKFMIERGESNIFSKTAGHIVEFSSHKALSVENMHSNLKKFKLFSHIPEFTCASSKVKPLRILGLVVEPPISKVYSPVKVCFHPVIIQMTKPKPKLLGQMKCSRPMDLRTKEALCESHTSSVLAQQHHFTSLYRSSTSTGVISEEAKSKIRENSVASSTENASESADEDLPSLKFLASLKDDRTLSPEIVVKIGEVFLSEQIEEKPEYYEVVSTNPDILFEICKVGEVPDPTEMDNNIPIPEKLILDCEFDSASEFGGSMDEEMNRAAFFDYMEDPFTISDDSLWFALSLDADFDRKIVHKNNCDNDELDVVKNARNCLPKLNGLLELDAANSDDLDVDYASKRHTKVQFKDEDKLCEIEKVDRNLAPKSIKSCASNFKVPERSIYKKPQTQELGRFISVKEFSQPLTEEERKGSETEMQIKIDECREVFSNLKGKHETDQLQGMFDMFLESFKFSRENFAEIATIQILQYTNWLVHIKRTISGALALASGAGSRFILLLSFIDQTGKSEWSLVRAEKDIQNISELLSNVTSMLEQVQDAILQLRLEFPEYVVTMIEIAETALRSRKELLEIYSMFCLSSLKDSTDISIVHYCTGYENFVQKTKFLANEESSDYEVNFATALNDLQRSHDIVSGTKTTLEKHLNLISNKLSQFRLELASKRLSQETAVSMKSSPSELSLGGQTLAGGSSDDISGPVDGQGSDSTMKSRHENVTETKQESKQAKAKFEVPKWMKFKGFGKKV